MRDTEAIDLRLVLPDILSKSRSGDSDSTQMLQETAMEHQRMAMGCHLRSSTNLLAENGGQQQLYAQHPGSVMSAGKNNTATGGANGSHKGRYNNEGERAAG